MIPLTEAPWWADNAEAIILGFFVLLGILWQHRRTNIKFGRQDAQLKRIEDSAKTTEDHVANGTVSHKETPMRDDLDALASSVQALRSETSDGIADLQTEFRGLVGKLAKEQSRQGTEISLIRAEQVRQVETTAANRERADSIHAGIFRRMSALEATDRFKAIWPWSARRDQ